MLRNTFKPRRQHAVRTQVEEILIISRSVLRPFTPCSLLLTTIFCVFHHFLSVKSFHDKKASPPSFPPDILRRFGDHFIFPPQDARSACYQILLCFFGTSTKYYTLSFSTPHVCVSAQTSRQFSSSRHERLRANIFENVVELRSMLALSTLCHLYIPRLGHEERI